MSNFQASALAMVALKEKIHRLFPLRHEPGMKETIREYIAAYNVMKRL